MNEDGINRNHKNSQQESNRIRQRQQRQTKKVISSSDDTILFDKTNTQKRTRKRRVARFCYLSFLLTFICMTALLVFFVATIEQHQQEHNQHNIPLTSSSSSSSSSSLSLSSASVLSSRLESEAMQKNTTKLLIKEGDTTQTNESRTRSRRSTHNHNNNNNNAVLEQRMQFPGDALFTHPEAPGSNEYSGNSRSKKTSTTKIIDRSAVTFATLHSFNKQNPNATRGKYLESFSLKKLTHYNKRQLVPLNSQYNKNQNFPSTASYYFTILPSQMKRKYSEMWNHNTSTIQIPEEYKYPFGKHYPKTSLEILESVLHGPDNEVEYAEVDDYISVVMKRNKKNGKLMEEDDDNLENKKKIPPLPNCLTPNTQRTRQLADALLQGNVSSLALPIFNVGFPKAGSFTLHSYFNCIGIPSNHGQNGDRMHHQTTHQHSLFQVPKFPRYLSWMQLDFNFQIGYYPQIELLDELHEEFPNATFIMNFRPIRDWIQSIEHHAMMKHRLGLMHIPGLIQENQTQRDYKNKERGITYTLKAKQHVQAAMEKEAMKKNQTDTRMYNTKNNNITAFTATSPHNRKLKSYREIDDDTKKKNARRKLNNYYRLRDEQLARWWCGHVKHIREYTATYYPSHTFIELDLYNTTETSHVVYDLFVAGSSQEEGNRIDTIQKRSCWGHQNKIIDRHEIKIEKKRKKDLQSKQPDNDGTTTTTATTLNNSNDNNDIDHNIG